MMLRTPMSTRNLHSPNERKLLKSFILICLNLFILTSEHSIKVEKNLKMIVKRGLAGNLEKNTLVVNLLSDVVTKGITGNTGNVTENIASTINSTTATNSTTTNIKAASINNDTMANKVPILVVFRIKSLWPVERDSLEKDIASAFNHIVLTQNYINVTAHIINVTCLWSCPRSKRSLDSYTHPDNLTTSSTIPKNDVLPSSNLSKPLRVANYEVDSSVNNTVIVFNPTYGNGTTPRWLTTLSNIKYNDYNSAQGSVLEASAVQILFAVFQGRTDERSPIDASTVVSIFRLYGSYNLLNQQLKTVDEVLSFPISFAEFLASTEPPPLPPSPSSTLLIPAWAIFLLVFVSFIIVLFIIWIVYSCLTGKLKEGGAALLVEDSKESHDYAHKGPLSHEYNINLNKDVTSPQPQMIPKPTRSIRFDRSTSYDVGLLSKFESDKFDPVYKASYKRRESREGATKRRINQNKQTNSELGTDTQIYRPKFSRLNSAEKLSSRTKPGPLIQETPPSPVSSLKRDQDVGNNSLSEQSDIDDFFFKNKSGAITTDLNKFFYPSPYPIFRPLQGSYPYPSISPMSSIYHYLNPVSVVAYRNSMPHATHSNVSISYSDNLQQTHSQASDMQMPKPEKFRKMAKDLVGDAFDDSDLSTTSLNLKNKSFEKPTDMEEFRKILDDAFAFNKSSPRL